MQVLIVAKTRQGRGACIGGITFDGHSVRLIAADAPTNEQAGLEYEVGEVWEVNGVPADHVTPPHVENIVVRSKRRLGLMTDPVPFVEARMPALTGGPDGLYEGLVQMTRSGALYIATHSGIPPYSTTFWRPDQPLQRTEESKRIRYRYPAPDGGPTLVFVGFQEPIAMIPAGALVRVSLAHWWRPDNDEAGELRCYVQLSGWFLPKETVRTGELRTIKPAQEPAQAAPPIAPLPVQSAAPASPASPIPRASDLKEARGLLKTVFGYDTFRPLQAEIITNILNGRDTLGVMPTGSGKSLCYQLPALLFNGLTVVVSPLIALMQDQVTQLLELGVPTAFLNSTLEYQEYLKTVARVRAGKIKLLYTSPETLLRPETLVLLDQAAVACLVIDEAHCISEWGHDFRPEYRRLRPVRERYPAAVCAAFTATATPRVQEDIKDILGFQARDSFVASYNRENLFLQVLPRRQGFAQVTAFLQQHPDQSGIIYCSTRRQVDELAARLSAQGWPALPYHAGLDSATRGHHQDLFARDKAPIIVATIAFGMGINKSNVRFVLHYNLPGSLEDYYQEIGRAGRDGMRADCLLLFSRSDLAISRRHIEEGAAKERPGRHARLQAMLRYAEATACRRGPLLAYFGDEPSEERCGFCDDCLAAKTPGVQIDATAAAQKFLACVRRTGQVFGVTHIVRVLRGSRSADVSRWHHEQVAEYGTGQAYPAAQWRHFAEQFIRQGLLEQDMGHGGLRITAKGHAVLQGEKVLIAAAVPAQGSMPEVTAYDQALFARLRTLRRELAEAADLPPYVVFSDHSLAEMATYFPQSPRNFLAIHGVGQRKLAQYGEPFLTVIRAHCAEHGIAERPRHVVMPSLGTAQKRRFEQVGELFAAGYSVAELQAMFSVVRYTIVQHLGRCVWAGQRFPIDRLAELSGLGAEDQALVLAAFAEHGTSQLRPVFDALNEKIPYEELHVMRMIYYCMPHQEPE